jgi:hypothetical protein
MANKFLPKVSAPGSSRFPNGGGRNPKVGTSGSGMAPVPRGGAPIPGNDRPSMPGQAGLARVAGAGSSPTGVGSSAGSFTPVQKPVAGLANQRVGQKEVAPPGSSARARPVTSTAVTGNPVATQKPKRRGIGANFYGEY